MTFKINSLSLTGDGIAQTAAGPIYAPFSLPGEQVSGTLIGNRITELRITTPSEHRVKAPCPHFKSCGGCMLQHASDAFVARWKGEVIGKALRAQGLSYTQLTTITSPARTRRRATFAGRRGKKAVMVGFHGRASGTIIPIPSCTLLHPDIMAAHPAMAALTVMGASRKAAIALAITQSPAGLDIAVSGAKDADGPMMAELGHLVEAHKLARLSWNGEVIAMRAHPVQTFDDIPVTPPPGAFLQATAAGQSALIDTVRAAVGPADTIVDLFAGCGTFSLPLAKQAQVLAVEGDADLLHALDAGWRSAHGLKTLKTSKRDLFRNPMLAEELSPYAAAIIDPPRPGAKAQCQALAQSGVPRIAYVSCNPITFARDAKILTDAGFTIDWVQPIDQFRWSTHVELVAAFVRAK
ncbi:MAG: class I SAM-dependent RNA methyltransferase [Paracoccaceae bacterium]